MSLVWGEKDVIANPGYAEVTAAAFADLYGAEADQTSRAHNVDGVKTQVNQWRDGQGLRVRTTVITGLGHAWPAGGGSGASPFMAADTLNYPAQLTEFLFANNRRVERANATAKADTTEAD